MIKLDLKHGTMIITIEETQAGQYQRVARYHLTGKDKTLTSRSKAYKTERGATAEAEKFAVLQGRVFSK